MNSASFIYYGYDRDTYRDCKPQIDGMNLKHMVFMNTWLLVVTIIILGIRIYDSSAVSSIFVKFNMNGLDRVGLPVFIVFAVLAALLEVLIAVFRKHPAWPFQILVYMDIMLMIAFSLLLSMAQNLKPAVLFPALLVLISVSYIDNMISMGVVMCGLSACFLLGVFKGFPAMRFQPKPPSIANEDVFSMVLFLSLSLVLHYTRQRTRLQQFVTYLKNIQITRELEEKSSFDMLTSLLNRGRFMTMAGEVLRGEHDHEYMAICLLDLDSFKQINDKLGHQMGDKALQITGRTIIEQLGGEQSERWSFPERALKERLSFAGRLGGDEFIVFFRSEKNKEELFKHLKSLLTALNCVDFGDLHGIHSSFGVTEITAADHDIDRVYNRADDALYRSKRAGKNRITFDGEKESRS
ncbi:MAG: GGDEF domain-containing protein [Lachnospiraceae bacterium]|nr:GGDEF domain-containing protein [Lachnospiraceae bacterium]